MSESDGIWGPGTKYGPPMNQLVHDNIKFLEEQLAASREEVRVLKEQNAILIEALRSISKNLNAIKFELDSSVYTLVDDEFEQVFDCRDMADEALAKVGAG